MSESSGLLEGILTRLHIKKSAVAPKSNLGGKKFESKILEAAYHEKLINDQIAAPTEVATVTGIKKTDAEIREEALKLRMENSRTQDGAGAIGTGSVKPVDRTIKSAGYSTQDY
jgi:hypothetical protein